MSERTILKRRNAVFYRGLAGFQKCLGAVHWINMFGIECVTEEDIKIVIEDIC